MEPPRADHAVSAHQVGKRFGKTVALADVSLDVPWGKVVGLVGPNGCGKTTFMRILAGRLRCDRGAVHVGGIDPGALHRTGPRLGYMPQEGGLYPELTVQQNVRFFAAAQGVPRAKRRRAVDEAIEMARLAHRRDDRVIELSGGLRRRASLAAALVNRPHVLLLDEPTVGVDPEIRAEMWDMMRRICSHGATILVSTHYIGEATKCDGVALLRKGRVLDKGTPRSLLHKTGTDDLEDAFIALLEATEEGP